MAFHRFKIVDDDVSHWEGDKLVISRMDSARLLRAWGEVPESSVLPNTTEGYETFLKHQLKDAPRR